MQWWPANDAPADCLPQLADDAGRDCVFPGPVHPGLRARPVCAVAYRCLPALHVPVLLRGRQPSRRPCPRSLPPVALPVRHADEHGCRSGRVRHHMPRRAVQPRAPGARERERERGKAPAHAGSCARGGGGWSASERRRARCRLPPRPAPLLRGPGSVMGASRTRAGAAAAPWPGGPVLTQTIKSHLAGRPSPHPNHKISHAHFSLPLPLSSSSPSPPARPRARPAWIAVSPTTVRAAPSPPPSRRRAGPA